MCIIYIIYGTLTENVLSKIVPTSYKHSGQLNDQDFEASTRILHEKFK